jgi:hypothetical protein
MDPNAEPAGGRSFRLITQIIAGTHTADHF